MHKSAFILLFFCFSHLLQAQKYFFERWAVDDGLPVSTITQMVQDPLGFIWLGTDGGGLVQFDGKTFKQHPVFDSLPSPFITVLKQFDAGFWIGTEKGIAHYDGRNLKTFAEQPQNLRARINAVLPMADGNTWIATRNGLFLFAGDVFTQPLSEFNNLDVFSLQHWNDGLLLASSAGLFAIDSKNKIQQLPMEGVLRIFKANGQIFLGAQKEVLLLNNDGTARGILQAENVRAIAYHDERLWFGTAAHGIYRSTSTGYERIDASNGLIYDRCRSLLSAQNGQLWVGSLSGLSKLISPNIVAFDITTGLTDDRIHGLLALPNGTIWGGTASGVFQISDRNVSFFSKKEGFPEGVVFSIVQDNNQNIWFGTERGLVRFSGGVFSVFTEKNGLSDPFVFSLKWFENTLYIGTTTGLFTYEKNKFLEIGGSEDVFADGIQELIEWHNKLYAISLSGMVYAIENNQLQPLKTLLGHTIDNLMVQHLQPLNDTLMAIAFAEDGLYIFSPAKKLHLDARHGLLAKNVKSLAANTNQLWVGTDQGLFVVNNNEIFNNPIFRQYNATSGFMARECNERSITLAPNGKLYVGTNAGLFAIRNKKIVEPRLVRPIFTGVDLFFDEYTDWSLLADSVNKWNGVPHAIRLPFDQNYLTFKFTTTQFSAEPIFLRYKLDGQDEEWTVVRQRNEAVFTNIQPGKYTFKLQCAVRPDFTNASEISLPVTIIPPYYRTIWFWLIISIFVAAIVIGFFRYRINQLNQRLNLEAALAESERKALRLQMNPHFVFNAMDAISGFIFKNEPKEAVRYLSSFAKLMRITLESSREQHVPLQNEIQLLKNYIELEQLRFSHAFDFDIHVAEEIDPFELFVAPMLLQPFVENAILHGLRHKKNGRGKLDITFKITPQNLICVIQDNGIGRQRSADINESSHKKSLATAITQERIDLLAKSRGNRVDFSITDLCTPQGEPEGTRVEVVFPLIQFDDMP